MTVKMPRQDDLHRERTARDPHQAAPSIGFVSTYPPAMCGLATFTASLRVAMARNRGSSTGLDVVELIDESSNPGDERPEVIASIDPADSWSVERAAKQLAFHDAVIIQHEYGIWGPEMGAAVLDFAEALPSPSISTLHTLLPDPTPIQRRIIEGLSGMSSLTVVPTLGARELLLARYRVDERSVEVIPHGTARRHGPVAPAPVLSTATREPQLLTWGLIGPGKGLEWALRAVASLRERYPRIHYTIAGRTHPKVLAREGETYRRALEELTAVLGIEENVQFADGYLSDDMLHSLLHAANVVVLPYDSSEQIVSGVLVEAVAANVPVVATSFPHAVELANEGAVVTVRHRRPDAIADAIASLLDAPAAMEAMATAQRIVSANLEWGSIARRYEDLVEAIVSGRAGISRVPTAS